MIKDEEESRLSAKESDTMSVSSDDKQKFKRPNRANKDRYVNDYFYINQHWCADNKTLNIMKNWYPFKFKLAYPRNSNLDSNQQKEFLELHAKFSKGNDLVQSDSKKYKRYMVSNICITVCTVFPLPF